MLQQRHHETRLLSRRGRRKGTGLSDAADYYWPLTIFPSPSPPNRSLPVWIVLSAVVSLGAALVVVLRHGIPAW
jgi:hypothetical protein